MNQKNHCVRFALPVVGLIVLGTGCGGGESTTLVSVKGKVTLDGGPMPSGGTVFFYPVGKVDGHPSHPGTGYWDVKGDFVARTFEPGDGLTPGKYQVSFKCFSETPSMTGKKVKAVLPVMYGSRDTSGFEVEVKDSEGVIEFEFPLKS